MKLFSAALHQTVVFPIFIIPVSDGTFVAWDPIGKSRIYKKGTTEAAHWPTRSEAEIQAVKLLNKKYGPQEWEFL